MVLPSDVTGGSWTWKMKSLWRHWRQRQVRNESNSMDWWSELSSKLTRATLMPRFSNLFDKFPFDHPFWYLFIFGDIYSDGRCFVPVTATCAKKIVSLMIYRFLLKSWYSMSHRLLYKWTVHGKSNSITTDSNSVIPIMFIHLTKLR